MTINPHIYPNPGYDPLVDIAPITRLGVGPQALAVHKGVPARSVEELVALARAKPGDLTFMPPGVGTPGHLASSLLMHLGRASKMTSRALQGRRTGRPGPGSRAM